MYNFFSSEPVAVAVPCGITAGPHGALTAAAVLPPPAAPSPPARAVPEGPQDPVKPPPAPPGLPTPAATAVACDAAWGAAVHGPFLICWAVQIGVLAFVCRRTATPHFTAAWQALALDDRVVLGGLLLVALVKLFQAVVRHGVQICRIAAVCRARRAWDREDRGRGAAPGPGYLGWVAGAAALALVVQGVVAALFALCTFFLAAARDPDRDPSRVGLVVEGLALLYVFDLNSGFNEWLRDAVGAAEHELRKDLRRRRRGDALV